MIDSPPKLGRVVDGIERLPLPGRQARVHQRGMLLVDRSGHAVDEGGVVPAIQKLAWIFHMDVMADKNVKLFAQDL